MGVAASAADGEEDLVTSTRSRTTSSSSRTVAGSTLYNKNITIPYTRGGNFSEIYDFVTKTLQLLPGRILIVTSKGDALPSAGIITRNFSDDESLAILPRAASMKEQTKSVSAASSI